MPFENSGTDIVMPPAPVVGFPCALLWLPFSANDRMADCADGSVFLVGRWWSRLPVICAARDHLAIEMRELLDQPDILQPRRTPHTHTRVTTCKKGRGPPVVTVPRRHRVSVPFWDNYPFLLCEQEHGSITFSIRLLPLHADPLTDPPPFLNR